MAKKRKSVLRMLLIKLTAIIFLVSVFIYFWNVIRDNLVWVIASTGALLVVFWIFFPEFSSKKFFKGMKKRF